MTKPSPKSTNLGTLSNKIYDVLHGLESQDRAKVMNSVAQLFGDQPISEGPPAQNSSGAGSQNVRGLSHKGGLNEQQYFVQKNPHNKGEMLAVAAKYREEHGAGTSHTKEDFAKFFSDARQNFDRGNFLRDMKNAQNQAQLFNKGTPRGQYQLSYYGQQYVDTLPDRDAARKLKRLGRKGAKRKKAGSKS